jgi:hypothetical protein
MLVCICLEERNLILNLVLCSIRFNNRLMLLINESSLKCNNSSSDLKSCVLLNIDWNVISDMDQCSKLWLLILQKELSISVFNCGMKSRYRNVIDSQVTIVTSSKGEFLFISTDHYCMNSSAWVLFEIHGFKYYERSVFTFRSLNGD